MTITPYKVLLSEFNKTVNALQSEIASNQLKGKMDTHVTKEKINLEVRIKYIATLLNPSNLQGENKTECIRARRSFEILLGASNLGTAELQELRLPVSADPKVDAAVAQIQAATPETRKEAEKFILSGAQQGAAESDGYWWMPGFISEIIKSVTSTVSYYMGLDASQQKEVQEILKNQTEQKE